jgi:hypothetical protein
VLDDKKSTAVMKSLLDAIAGAHVPLGVTFVPNNYISLDEETTEKVTK